MIKLTEVPRIWTSAIDFVTQTIFIETELLSTITEKGDETVLNGFEYRIVSSAKPVAPQEGPRSVRIGNAKI